MTTSPTKNQVHIFLENLIKDKFNVFIEVYHNQFDTPVRLPNSKKLIRARTTVLAYSSAEDAMKAHNEPGSVEAIALASSECSVNDQFVKRVGLQKALHRLYRELSSKVKVS